MKLTCSICKGKGSLRHNNRSFSAKSVLPELSRNNFVLIDTSLDETYKKIFGAAVAEYNARQKDKRQIIRNYLEKIERSKQEKPFYELVIEIGNTNDIKKGSPEEDLARKALDEYVSKFQERNPAFHVFQAIRHEDEPDSLCHYHLDFVPVSTGNKRGLETKNSFSGALKQMGFSRNGFAEWRDHEQQELIRCMNRHGIEFKTGTGRSRHYNIEDYKFITNKVNAAIEELPTGEPEMAGIWRKETGRVSYSAEEDKRLKTLAKAGIRRQFEIDDIAGHIELCRSERKKLEQTRRSLEEEKRCLMIERTEIQSYGNFEELSAQAEKWTLLPKAIAEFGTKHPAAWNHFIEPTLSLLSEHGNELLQELADGIVKEFNLQRNRTLKKTKGRGFSL